MSSAVTMADDYSYVFYSKLIGMKEKKERRTCATPWSYRPSVSIIKNTIMILHYKVFLDNKSKQFNF